MSHKILQIHILPQLFNNVELLGWCFSTRVIRDVLRVKNKISITGLVVSCVRSVLALPPLSLAVCIIFQKCNRSKFPFISYLYNSTAQKAWLYHIYIYILAFIFLLQLHYFHYFHYQLKVVLPLNIFLNGYSDRQLCIH